LSGKEEEGKIEKFSNSEMCKWNR